MINKRLHIKQKIEQSEPTIPWGEHRCSRRIGTPMYLGGEHRCSRRVGTPPYLEVNTSAPEG